MTNKLPVAAPQNIWYDAEPVSSTDLSFEQTYNNTTNTSLINNQIGSGSIPNTLIQNIIFDSALVTGELDGKGISAQNQPSDPTFGNQLSVSLSNSLAASNRTVKVAIIGLDFNSNIQFETFTFHLNETQYSKKHFTNILTLLFDDFIGAPTISFNLGGHIVIQEIASYTISRSPIMVSQDQQPNLFFRDFAVNATYNSLQAMLTAALPLYNFDNLNITTGILENLAILQGDVTTQIGEKFLATTNNIQKVTLLLSVQNSAPGQAANLIWQGDLVISIYPLQSTVDCVTDIVPNLAINFTPSNVPLAQTSINYSSLQATGIVLDGNPQPVDFNFSNTQIANGIIIPNAYYIVTVKRSGSASACDILLAAGNALTANSQVSTFTGVTWVDNPDVNLWFQIWTDAIKVSDGQAYETGHGIVLPKTILDPLTNITVDNSLGDIYFTGTNEYTAVLSALTQSSEPQPDQRTGNPVDTQQEFVPSVQLYNALDLTNLEKASEPLTIGLVIDKNIKAISSSPTILAALHSWTFVGNTIVIKIIDDMTDARYDLNVIALVSDLLNGQLTDAKIIPDLSNPTVFYRIASASLCSRLYGDADGDGLITINDLNICTSFVGANMNISPPPPPAALCPIHTGTLPLTTNGYLALSQPFVNDLGLSWWIVNATTNVVIASASDGVIVVNPNNPTLASFESLSTNFSLIASITTYNLVISDTANLQNQGSFSILAVDNASTSIIDIQKILFTPLSIQQMLSCDIDGNFQITTADGTLIDNYINRVPPFPPTSSPANKIGTPFSILTITVEDFIDRTDDFQETIGNRSLVLHPVQDIFLNDSGLQSHNFLTTPVSLNIVQQFTWEPYLVAVAGNARPVPTVFSNETGLVLANCVLDGVSCENYATPPVFDPGTVDVFTPNNLILGGQITMSDGYYWKGDIETYNIVLEIPNTVLGVEQTLNIFDYFVADNGGGVTRLGYPAARFADCSTVQSNALLNNQVRFGVAIESLGPSDGYTIDGYTSDFLGVYFDHSSGLLKLNFTYFAQDPVLKTLNTKVNITVSLKKAGFNNAPLFVGSMQMTNLLTLIPPG
jgi:hypothetical protein